MFNGLFLGILTWLSIVMTFSKWPDWLKRLVVRHELLADIIAGFSIWAILGLVSKTLTAVTGAIIGEILIGLSLYFYGEQYRAGKVLQRPTKSN